MDRGVLQATVHKVTRAGHDLVTKTPPTNKDLLYNTGNLTQYSLMTYVEKNLEKSEYISMCKRFTLVYTRN